MPPAQDDNPFGTPRGAWGRQPPTTFGLSTPVKRPARPSNQIRVPAPSLAPRNVLTGGVIPRPSPAPSPPPPPPAPENPVPAVEPPDPSLVSDPVLVRASAAPKGRGLLFPPVAGIGVLIAAIVVAGLMLLRREPPAPEPATVALPQAPAPAPAPAPAQPAPTMIAEPAVAPPPETTLRTARSAPVSRPATPAPEAPAPILPPPLAAPPIVAAPPAPAPAAAAPPPTDPEAPMTTRLPGPQ